MINELDIVQGIYSILEEIGDSLPSENVIDTKELLEHNEWGEALDLLCTQLYEYDVEISSSTYEKIEWLGEKMEMEPKVWTILKDLVNEE
ncbi:MAG: hypothetical protein CME32_11785 [Gimesia sp.]|nr:hypothetical protein [Gimesia sp.]